MKRQKSYEIINLFDLLSDEIMFTILDLLNQNPLDKKAFSLVCKSFYNIESKHRRTLKPLRQEHLLRTLNRYPNVAHIDLTLCPRVNDSSLEIVAKTYKKTLRSIDLSRSRFFSGSGLLSLAENCKNLVEIDLSNSKELQDSALANIAEAKNLEKLWLVRCKKITDMGVGCIAVGCKKLRLLSLKWCLGVGDLGVELIAFKCKEIRYLDLSCLPITNECLPSILKLQYLEDLILEGCFCIDDDNLADIGHRCKSLKLLDMSNCHNISHVGLSSLIGAAESLQQLTLGYGSPVTVSLVDSLKKLSVLQSIRLDGAVVTCDVLKAIGSFPMSLRELSLSKCSGITDDGLSFLIKKHEDLRKLHITCCRKITYIAIAHITSSCANLVSLRMESCTMVPREAYVLIGERCRFLEELDVTDNEIDDEGLKSIARCSNLSILKLGICLNITDAGLAHVGMCCPKLKELDLYRSAGITDIGILAIARGCPDLEMINTSYCYDITDRSLHSLSKCLRLNTFESRGCPLITSLGLAAIAVGCKQLIKLDVKKCLSIDDAGMIPLAQFSQNLKQITLSYSSVTDMGLLSLASISCLQNLTVLHLKGLTPSGLAAALLACVGLTKVKLHASFKPLLPQLIFEHLEARGCVFEWRDKVFQPELDPKCWKLQVEDIVH
ncbi:putative F-box protein atfbl3 [Tripterygium wilfordii]|uniref:Putative F-box protein atfbl3 n=1 Tax=Tripterygium wilfordii TaxID=458696 RepID=A0A7J7DMQ4_TRIWF|nr:F-box/LRR-repeat protein 3-like [Tripterygium wilfordii]KAF5747652.1 putative F-box protein atfbl3 [Tripterygium wilfordii]